MRIILIAVSLLSILSTQVSASFMYQEIDPICSISGTTHTSFPGEISDTSSWAMPKAYDRECLEYDILTDTEKARIFEILSGHFESKGYVEMRKDFANINQEGREFVNTRYFPAITAFIQREVQKQEPNLRHLALMSYAAKIIAYDYTLSR